MIAKGHVLPFGWRYILPVWAVTLIVLVFSDEIPLNLLMIAVSFATAAFFYVPERTPFDTGENALVAPVDGVVEAVTRSSDGSRVRIRKTLAGSTAVRFPMACEAEEILPRHGVFLGMGSEKAGTLNEQAEIGCRRGPYDIRIKLVNGFYALGLPLFARKGPVHAGEPLALMTDGLVELTLPGTFDLSISKGDRVRGGYSILGYGGA